MSTTNTTGRVRISADVRWQPAGAACDPRYVGDVRVEDRVKSGLLRADDAEDVPSSKVTIGALKARWGLRDGRFAESS